MGTYIYKIDLDDGTVYESTEEYIIKSVFPGIVDTDVYCPKCETEWTVTKFGNNVWHDCKSCNKKKEDILP